MHDDNAVLDVLRRGHLVAKGVPAIAELKAGATVKYSNGKPAALSDFSEAVVSAALAGAPLPSRHTTHYVAGSAARKRREGRGADDDDEIDPDMPDMTPGKRQHQSGTTPTHEGSSTSTANPRFRESGELDEELNEMNAEAVMTTGHGLMSQDSAWASTLDDAAIAAAMDDDLDLDGL